jgi:L-alanine-DL-glutamate epimerase-like enolase superfamily enzyme
LDVRLDANGAFHPDEALQKLEVISRYKVHSIEQPIKAGQWTQMAELCRLSPVDIALDEELIGLEYENQQQQMLETILPKYIIIKPSLVGGLLASEQWINLAKQLHINWWATSALEANIGLNAIAQWAFNQQVTMPQGLGTGKVFTNNIPSPLTVIDGKLWYLQQQGWDFTVL